MKIETIKQKIESCEAKITKLNGTLERHTKQLHKKAENLIKKGIDLNNYDKYDKSKIDHDTYWDLCDYEGKLEDVENNNKKIQAETNTIEKLKKQLNDQLAKDEEVNNSIPEILNTFLENWKQKCYNYYIDLANRYVLLLSKDYKEFQITKEELERLEKREYNSKKHRHENVRRFTDEEIEVILNNNGVNEYELEELKKDIKRRYVTSFEQGHFGSDMVVLSKIIEKHTIDTEALNKILDYDVKVKKEMFINRIKEVIGEIKDLSGLRIGDNGEINGIAIGVKANAKVETISAGGYNIQCYHFRVLVNTIK